MENREKSKWASIMGPLSLGAVMFSTYVGPGFASGTQTVSYFLTKGWVGVVLGPIVAALIALVLNIFLFQAFRVYQPKHFREAYNYIYQNKIINFIVCNMKDISTVLMVIVSISGQISAAAAIFNNLFGLPSEVGRIIFAVIMLVLCLYGAKMINASASVLTIAILAVTVYIGVVSIPMLWPKTVEFMGSGITMADGGFSTFSGWYIMISFSHIFLGGQNACATTSRGILVDKKSVLISSFTSIGLCLLSTLVYTVIFAGAMPEAAAENIPTLYVLQKAIGASMVAQIMYSILAVAAMVSTGVSLIFAMSARFEGLLGKVWKKSSARIRMTAIAGFFALICLYGSRFGLLDLVRFGYVNITKFAFPITTLPLLFFVPYQIWRDRKDGKINADGFFVKAELSNASAESET